MIFFVIKYFSTTFPRFITDLALIMLSRIVSLLLSVHIVRCFQSGGRVTSRSGASSTRMAADAWEPIKKPLKFLAAGSLMLQLSGLTTPAVWADEAPAPTESAVSSSSSAIPKVALYTQRSTDLQVYTDINRGFKMLR